MTRFRMVAPIAVLALVLTACPAGDTSDTPGASASGTGGGEQLGGSISILAVYADAEQESFMAMIQPWADENGVEVEYSATRDINAQLTTQIAGGNPPDIAGLPGPGPMAQFARDGDLVPLDDVIDMDTYASQYDEGWITAGTVDDQLVVLGRDRAIRYGAEWKSMFNGNLVGIPQTGSPIPQEAVREFRVHLNPYDARYTRGASFVIVSPSARRSRTAPGPGESGARVAAHRSSRVRGARTAPGCPRADAAPG